MNPPCSKASYFEVSFIKQKKKRKESKNPTQFSNCHIEIHMTSIWALFDPPTSKYHFLHFHQDVKQDQSWTQRRQRKTSHKCGSKNKPWVFFKILFRTTQGLVLSRHPNIVFPSLRQENNQTKRSGDLHQQSADWVRLLPVEGTHDLTAQHAIHILNQTNVIYTKQEWHD